MQPGFYKKDNNEILFSPDNINGPEYSLSAANKNDFVYPVDGWIWAENLDDAINKFVAQTVEYCAPFKVEPEGYYLASSRNDETEFNKLATLTQLMISQGKLLLSTIIKVKDSNGQPRAISVSRFLDVVSDYGMFCFLSRN